jgi:hypothetical protein
MGNQGSDIPELHASRTAFYDNLDRATTPKHCDEAGELHKEELRLLRGDGTITKTHYNTLMASVPIVVAFKKAKLSGEVGVKGKSPAKWAHDEGYLKGPQAVGILQILSFLPETLGESAGEYLKDPFRGFGKTPTWVYILLAIAGIAGILYAVRTFKA